MFPFTIQYRKILDDHFDSISNENILKCFKQNLKKGGVDRIYIEDNSILRFENAYFAIRPGLNWSIWEGIRRGSFEILKNENQRILIYTIKISKLIIPFFLFGLAIGLFAIMMSIGAGLLILAWICLLPWLTKVLRHKYKLLSLLDEVLKENESKNVKEELI